MAQGETISYAVFSKETDFEKIINTIYEQFHAECKDSKNTILLENEQQRIEVQVLIEHMGEQFRNYIDNLKNNMSNAVWNMECEDDDIKNNLLRKLQLAKTYIMVNVIKKDDSMSYEQFEENAADVRWYFEDVINVIDGVVMSADGSCAWNEEGNIILNSKGESEVPDYFPFEYVESPKFLKDCTQRQMERRNANMKYLFDNGIYVCELPVNADDEEVTIRDKREVVKRALGTMIVSLYSEAMLNPSENMSVPEARAFIEDVKNGFNLKKKELFSQKEEEVLTPNEIAYISNDNPTEREQIQYSWNYEHLYTLEWALGLVEWDYPEQICDVGGIVHIMNEFHSIDEICDGCVMRSKKEILDTADLIYRMDWAAVDARIHGLTGPKGLEHGVVQARHKTLNWLIGFENQEWDDVDTPT